jgi:hypothetical protein
LISQTTPIVTKKDEKIQSVSYSVVPINPALNYEFVALAANGEVSGWVVGYVVSV